MRIATTALLLVALGTTGLGQAPAVETPQETAIPLDQLLSSREMGSYLRNTGYTQRLSVLRGALERRAKRLESEIKHMDLAVVSTTLAEIRSVVAYAHALPTAGLPEKQTRHREVKRLEILLRKTTDQLNDQKLDVPYEERGVFEATANRIETLRNQLLRQLFGTALGANSGLPAGAEALSWAPPTASPAVQIRGLWDRDRFTEEEFSKVQIAQKLIKRVEVFLVIAESRLDEIERRRDGKEWEGKEENPLEFYTFDDLLFAYHRAIDGIMVNIDAQVEQRQVEEKDALKALEKLDEKIDGFVDRLKAMESYIHERRDPEFAEAWERAMKTSDIARKGASFGLGKPSTP